MDFDPLELQRYSAKNTVRFKIQNIQRQIDETGRTIPSKFLLGKLRAWVKIRKLQQQIAVEEYKLEIVLGFLQGWDLPPPADNREIETISSGGNAAIEESEITRAKQYQTIRKILTGVLGDLKELTEDNIGTKEAEAIERLSSAVNHLTSAMKILEETP